MQNTIQPLISLKIPEEILTVAESSDNEDKDETSSDEILKDINKTCFPIPFKVEDTNDMTHALAALVYFKLKQELLRGAKQFEVAVRYKINQKCLREILHGKKYLGGKQKKHRASGTKGDTKLIEDEDKEGEEEEEPEGRVEQGEVSSQKQKFDDDNDNDDVFEGTTKEFTTKPMPKKSKL